MGWDGVGWTGVRWGGMGWDRVGWGVIKCYEIGWGGWDGAGGNGDGVWVGWVRSAPAAT